MSCFNRRDASADDDDDNPIYALDLGVQLPRSEKRTESEKKDHPRETVLLEKCKGATLASSRRPRRDVYSMSTSHL